MVVVALPEAAIDVELPSEFAVAAAVVEGEVVETSATVVTTVVVVGSFVRPVAGSASWDDADP
jgi:hypothetical protein